MILPESSFTVRIESGNLLIPSFLPDRQSKHRGIAFPSVSPSPLSVNSWILTSFYGLQPTIVLVYSSTQIVPAWPLGTPSSWLLSPVDVPPSNILNTSCYLGSTKCSRLLYLPFLSPGISHFSNIPGSSEKMIFRNQDLSKTYSL